MDDVIMNIFVPLLNIKLLLLVATGTFAGIYIGAIPGLSVTMAVSLLISFTFSWSTHEALALMIGIYCGGVYGGSRSAILLNIPGAPAAIATGFDGHPLAKMGEAGKAIGVSTVQSTLGGLIGVIVLAVAAPAVSEFALKFAPRDYFLLAVMGLMLVGSLGTKSTAKGLFMATLGILLGLVGMDPLTGQGRFTFGSVGLMGALTMLLQ
ncbi:Tripartite tricarboxylate transporter TctA family protein [Anaerovirgula multivorans]|uniref:Tripartite tricarboxylate transporter TctA family protein n=1 Tax=Anaerovirgula multivorans TaxID=312168 RepID=A0A239HIQ6_9FIRM|nr:tripartite tricarboxylate transporter permease [Anaerovirgula multivorans]SNS81237.1 Tripartite tricarboxylate transporter TctA family protein [Anaerovirgula multivorans]